MAIAVVGSANMDLVVQTETFPRPGETVLGTGFFALPGGKGANQAVAIGRLGGAAALIGQVGRDGFGDDLVASLSAAGVSTEYLLRDADEASGIAAVAVDASGQNTIIVAPGANARLTPQHAASAIRALAPSVILAQLEVPIPAVLAAFNAAPAAVKILNPAPATDLPDELLMLVDYLTPNESECERLCGVMPSSERSCEEAARRLLERGVGSVVITLGAAGCFAHLGDRFLMVPSIQVDATDTTAAGDAFNGAFALFLSQDRDLEDALRMANAAGAISVTRRGAQASMPTMAEVESMISG
jgi:ribokinase